MCVFVQTASWLYVFLNNICVFEHACHAWHVLVQLVYLYIRFRIVFAIWNDVIVQMASWLTLCRIDLQIFVRFHTEDIVIIRFELFFLCLWISLWHVACFRTAGLLTSTIWNRFSSWSYIFVHTAPSLILFRIDLEMFGRFHT